MRVVARRSRNAYEPELYAMRDYFRCDPQIHFDVLEPHERLTGTVDLLYRKMGLSFGNSPWREIHDYSSLSAGSWARLKNVTKRYLNRRPGARSFLNPIVASRLRFRDDVPVVYRDMGVSDSLFAETHDCVPDHHLVYAGSMCTERKTGDLMEQLARTRLRCLWVGHVPQDLARKYGDVHTFTFTGAVPHDAIGSLLRRALVGLNYTPNTFPYNAQSSTKLIEYAAAGLGCISNRYAWSTNFDAKTGSRVLFAELDQLARLDASTLVDLAAPFVDSYRWSRVIDSSGLREVILACGN